MRFSLEVEQQFWIFTRGFRLLFCLCLSLCLAGCASSPSTVELQKLMQDPEAARKAVEVNPDNVNAHEALAIYYRQRGDFNNAAKHQREIVRLNSDNNLHRMEQLTLGVYLNRAGQHDEAMKIYRELAQENDAAGKRAQKILSKIQEKGNAR